MATIGHAMNMCPSREKICTKVLHPEQQGSKPWKPSIYMEDFQAFWPTLNLVMQRLMAGRKPSWREEVDSMDEIAPEYLVRLGNLAKNDALTKEEFIESTKTMYADLVCETLFVDCVEVGGYLRQGFNSLIGNTRCSSCMTDSEKKLVLTTSFKDIIVKAMIAFFTAKLEITLSEFLSRMRYSTDFPSEVKRMFIVVVSQFTPVETYRSHRYITNEKYVGGSLMNVIYHPNRSATLLPTALTCMKQLELPSYGDVEVMRSKLTFATFNTAYGHA